MNSSTNLPWISKSRFSRPARPMMARDADSMYWMSRYIERSEHIARLLLVNTNLLMDMGDLAPALLRQQWQSVITATRTTVPAAMLDHCPDNAMGAKVARHMAFASDNPNSLLCCLTRARENARSIREGISAEMWECLNALYWTIKSDEVQAHFEEAPDNFFRQIMNNSMLFQGLTDQTLPHDQRWHFAQLGKYLERIDVTTRVIESKLDILDRGETTVEGAMHNVQCMAILRSCCSIEAYRRFDMGDIGPLSVACFLLLESNFPRSVLYAVGAALHAITCIRRDANAAAIDPAERILGRLHVQLQFAEIEEITGDGLPAYLRKVQEHCAAAALSLQKSYFLH